MALGRVRKQQRPIDYWPGFVDALSTMLLVITFLLSVFMLSQFFMSREVTGKDTVLSRLNRQIEQLTSLLALERAGKSDTQSTLLSLQATLDSAQQEKSRLEGVIGQSASSAQTSQVQAAETSKALDAQRDVTVRAFAQLDVLNQQISALRKQLSAIESALDASESKDKDAQVKIADLGSRLNVALAQKVQELNRYRSDFFGRLREILGSKPGIRVVGDRFVFESQVLFDSGKPSSSRTARPNSTSSPPPSSISNARSRPTFPGSCGSTGIRTSGRSSRRSSNRTGTCRRHAPSRWCNIWSARESTRSGSPQQASGSSSRSRRAMVTMS